MLPRSHPLSHLHFSHRRVDNWEAEFPGLQVSCASGSTKHPFTEVCEEAAPLVNMVRGLLFVIRGACEMSPRESIAIPLPVRSSAGPKGWSDDEH